MYSTIMVPVDLAHLGTLTKALSTATDLAKHYDVPVVYVGVTSAAPGPLGHTPEEYGDKLSSFAAEQANAGGIKTSSQTLVSHDPTTDVDDALLQAVKDTGADLVVMASHLPGLADYVWPSNGGKIAAHSSASVFVVRG
ncbi:universal stress protein [Alphaproteobacteria bacterium GH1-50]|uniref:Universal stress protein n=1 Tax=Kangsaoukella pontilimi TaxID=2691042 RepID=A0A7C9IRP1_9RHOB|nr:universal stress protein [Kangsaoukella pontilimi]MXQ07145.1 universal stress protein [Kangsaoukella pontilimi]